MEANSATLLTLLRSRDWSLTDDAMTLDIHFGAGWWRFHFVPVGTQLSSYDLTWR